MRLRISVTLFILIMNFMVKVQALPPTQFREDFYWLNNIMTVNGMDIRSVEEFLDPNKGPLQFRLNAKNAPWAGNYFPMQDGGIANRWQKCEKGVCINLKTESDIKSLSQKAINKLSPIEKYDLLVSDYNFSATQHEMKFRGLKRPQPPQDWEGFCNGIRCASLITDEPRYAVTLKNAEGLNIRFEPADIKALLGANYFYVENYGQIGGPTQEGKARNQPNPAVFDLALRFYLGKNSKGFVIDTHLGSEIWNETVVGYKRSLSDSENLTNEEKKKYPQAIKKIKIFLVVETLGEIDIRESNKRTKKKVADGTLLSTVETGYTLYLDIQNKAIDGEWFPAKNERGIDFAWFASGEGFDHHFSSQGGNKYLRYENLSQLLKASTRLICESVFRY